MHIRDVPQGIFVQDRDVGGRVNTVVICGTEFPSRSVTGIRKISMKSYGHQKEVNLLPAELRG